MPTGLPLIRTNMWKNDIDKKYCGIQGDVKFTATRVQEVPWEKLIQQLLK